MSLYITMKVSDHLNDLGVKDQGRIFLKLVFQRAMFIFSTIISYHVYVTLKV